MAGIGFNSMIVRLKEKGFVKVEVLDEFQFYDSPIKSYWYGNGKRMDGLFQFYDSPIKSKFSLAVTQQQIDVSIL